MQLFSGHLHHFNKQINQSEYFFFKIWNPTSIFRMWNFSWPIFIFSFFSHSIIKTELRLACGTYKAKKKNKKKLFKRNHFTPDMSIIWAHMQIWKYFNGRSIKKIILSRFISFWLTVDVNVLIFHVYAVYVVVVVLFVNFSISLFFLCFAGKHLS